MRAATLSERDRPPPGTGHLLVGLLLCIAAALPHRAAGQDRPSPGFISGTVIEVGSLRPVALARLVAVASEGVGGAGTVTRHAVTDEQGRYDLGPMPPGRYRVRVHGVGYQELEFWTEVPEGTTLRRSARLTVRPVALERLAVAIGLPWEPLSRAAPGRHERATAPSSTEVPGPWRRADAYGVDPSTIPTTNTVGEPDVFRALQQLPGVSGRGDFAATFWTRGSPWGMTRILVDGLPLFNPVHGGGIAAGMQSEGLERVLLFPGVRPASLATGAAGTLDLRTARAGAHERVSFGMSTAAARTRVARRWSDGRAGLAVSRRRSWWDVAEIGIPGRSDDGSIGYHFANVSARFDVEIADRVRLDAGVMNSSDRVDGRIPGLLEDSDGLWGNRLGWASLTFREDDFFVRGFTGGTGHHLDTRPGPGGTIALAGPQSTLTIADTDIGYDALRIEVGDTYEGRFTWRAGAERARISLTQGAAGATTRALPGTDGQPASLGVGRAWIEGSARMGTLHANVGTGAAIGDEARTLGASSMPSVAVGWTPSRWFAFEFAAGRSSQFIYPLAAEGRSFGPQLSAGHVWALAGEGMPALISDTRTVTTRSRVGGGVSFLATAYERNTDGVWMSGLYTLAEGQPQLATGEGLPGRAEARGLEFVVQRDGERFTGSVAYSRTVSRLFAVDSIHWAAPSERPHSFEVLAFTRPADGLLLGFSLTAESGWPVVVGDPASCAEQTCFKPENGLLIDPRTERAPSYVSLDLMADWTLTHGSVDVSVTGAVRNLTGRNNAAAYGFDACPGDELFALLCSGQPGQGTFSAGLTSPTPTFAVRIVF